MDARRRCPALVVCARCIRILWSSAAFGYGSDRAWAERRGASRVMRGCGAARAPGSQALAPPRRGRRRAPFATCARLNGFVATASGFDREVGESVAGSATAPGTSSQVGDTPRRLMSAARWRSIIRASPDSCALVGEAHVATALAQRLAACLCSGQFASKRTDRPRGTSRLAELLFMICSRPIRGRRRNHGHRRMSLRSDPLFGRGRAQALAACAIARAAAAQPAG